MLRVLVNGTDGRNALDARVVSTNYYGADSFRVGFASSAPDAGGLNFWSDGPSPEIDVQVSTDGGVSYESLIVGRADTASFDPKRRIVRVSGRDLSARLVDTPLSEVLPNTTASAVVAMIALRAGLIPDVTPTMFDLAAFGSETQPDMGLPQFSQNLSEWDMIVRLATTVGYDAYVEGRTLHFHPAARSGRRVTSLTPADTTDIRLERSYLYEVNFASDILTWNTRLQRSLSEPLNPTDGAMDANTGLSVSSAGGPRLTAAPNQMSGTLANLAARFAEDRFRQTMSVEISMPGETAIFPRSAIALSGTGTAFDRTYKVECVERTFSPIRGFQQQIRALPQTWFGAGVL